MINNISTANGKNPVSVSSFTKGQLAAYTSLIEWINKPYSINDAKRALIGPAGTGKTYLVKALIMNCNLSYSTIGIAAPTHKACRVLSESINVPNIKASTLQSDLGLRLNFDVDNFDINHPPFDPRGRIKINQYRLYIVDEASMINRGLCSFLEKICKTHATKLIYIGDGYQLPPVNEHYSPAFTGIKCHELTEIVRQDDDNPVRELLDILRDDIKNRKNNFLNYITYHSAKFDVNNIKGYQCLDNTSFCNEILTYFSDEQITKNVDFVKVIAYTNNAVGGWNKYIRKNTIISADKSILTKDDLLISYITLVDDFNGIIIQNSEEYIIHDIVDYVHPKYDLKGFMVKFQAIHGGKITPPFFVIDHTDSFTLNNYVRISKQLVDAAKNATRFTRNTRWKEYYKFKESCLLLVNIANSLGTISYSRDIDYGFALTSHKSQGSTFDTVFVDVEDIVYDKYGRPYADMNEVRRRLYVACSRCRNKLYLKWNTKANGN